MHGRPDLDLRKGGAIATDGHVHLPGGPRGSMALVRRPSGAADKHRGHRAMAGRSHKASDRNVWVTWRPPAGAYDSAPAPDRYR